MGLVEYKRKRSFRKTPEPIGGKSKKNQLIFVIQKHAASRLHYDFRLELKGVLKSWAVPKGPSLNPKDKRLAMLVEDHPYDYKDFEGIIPAGNYGAGTVIIWDEGTYEPIIEADSKAEQEKILAKDFEKGSMKIRMFGKKLQGEFALVKMKGRGENSWLLIKHRDDFASEDDDITGMDESVISGKTIEELAGDERAETWKSNRSVSKNAARKTSTSKKSTTSKPRSAISRKKLSKTPSGKTFLSADDETKIKIVKGHELKFTNLSKIYWPDEGYTKRDMLNYYDQVIPYMLPYMKDRPQTLNRFPNGIKGKSFYQKDVTGKVPAWIKTYKYFSEGDDQEKHFLVCTEEASLLYIASLGCIEMNPWSSRTKFPDHPDWCVIDLDPGKKNSFEHVIELARVTKEILDVLELPSYCKTSGSTGLHIYIPLGAKYTYEDSKEFARAIVTLIHAQLPKITTLERTVRSRKGMMYLDFLQNRPQATLAGPYSLRPKPGAPVSMPLHWDEVKKGLKTEHFTIENAIDRLRQTGDLFDGVLGKGIPLQKAMKSLKTFIDKLK